MAPSLCHYRYDPLDRLANTLPMGEEPIARFYQKSRLATEVQGALQRTVFQHDDQLLAQHPYSGANNETSLLVTDQQRSVIQHADIAEAKSLVYTAYGHLPADSGLSTLLGFSGERRDPVTGHYLLGNGYRAFNPVLMRFNSPDSLSPFGEGGLNAYAYCQGDPVNYRDPTGHIKFLNRPMSTSPFIRRERSLSSPRVSRVRPSVEAGPSGSGTSNTVVSNQAAAVASPLSVAASGSTISITGFAEPPAAVPVAGPKGVIGLEDSATLQRLRNTLHIYLKRSNSPRDVPARNLLKGRISYFKTMVGYSDRLTRHYKFMIDNDIGGKGLSPVARYNKYKKVAEKTKRELAEFIDNVRNTYPEIKGVD